MQIGTNEYRVVTADSGVLLSKEWAVARKGKEVVEVQPADLPETVREAQGRSVNRHG